MFIWINLSSVHYAAVWFIRLTLTECPLRFRHCSWCWGFSSEQVGQVCCSKEADILSEHSVWLLSNSFASLKPCCWFFFYLSYLSTPFLYSIMYSIYALNINTLYKVLPSNCFSLQKWCHPLYYHLLILTKCLYPSLRFPWASDFHIPAGKLYLHALKNLQINIP